MNISPWTIYWITKLDDIRQVAIVFTILMGILLFVIAFYYCIDINDDDRESVNKYKNIFKSCVASFIIIVLIATFMPSTKTMATIYIIPKIANSEMVGDMSADAQELYKLSIDKLKTILLEEEE